MKELQEIINNKVTEMCNTGAISSLIENCVEKAVNEALANQFKSYNGLGKSLEKALEQKLQIDTSKLDLPTYNELISRCVNQKVNEFWQSQAAEKLLTSMDKIFAPIPTEMSVQGFCEKIAKYWETEDPCNCIDDLDDHATVEIEKDQRYSIASFTLKMWKQKRSSSYLGSSRDNAPDVDLYICADGHIRLRHQWNPTILHDEESFIIKAYASNLKLTGLDEADPDDWDLSLKPEFY